jgi:hypothetical protein
MMAHETFPSIPLRFLRLAHIHAAVLCLPGVDRCFDTPTSLATSSALRPASNCFGAPIICASVCLLFDIPLPFAFVRNHTRTCSESGEQVNRQMWTKLWW